MRFMVTQTRIASALVLLTATAFHVRATLVYLLLISAAIATDAQASIVSWATRADMPTARLEHAAATAANTKIYVMGGVATPGGIRLSTVEEYDPATNIWTTRSDMSVARYGLGAAASNDKVYAIGGSIGNTPFSVVEEYDPLTDVWIQKAAMPTNRVHLATVTKDDGKIYAVGGSSSGVVGALEVYDPPTDTWTIRANMPTARWLLTAAFGINGRLYVFGGDGDEGAKSAVEEYNPLTNYVDHKGEYADGSHRSICGLSYKRENLRDRRAGVRCPVNS